MPDREKVIKALELCAGKHECVKHSPDEHCPYEDWLGEYEDSFYECTSMLARDALALLKEQEAEKEALASLASLADHRRERVGKVLYDLCELGYPHNFQHEAPWVVDYLYKLTAIIKRAYEVKNNDDT